MMVLSPANAAVVLTGWMRLLEQHARSGRRVVRVPRAPATATATAPARPPHRQAAAATRSLH